ncbi:transglutaminase-like domain-containing protein [Nesterenkonia ebinurensis]|uniref:transglutaminase-like domain-containing protein n=1 Tax=Nesterenkonia ebinurensis TaxID=2608252 RepID=UPI00123DB5D5|nr:transglutaminase family protein [Nesterenkonia ebinurensis]
MQRSIRAHLDITVEDAADFVFIVSAALTGSAADRLVDETLTVSHSSVALEVSELQDLHGTRMHCVSAPTGQLTVDYRATVSGKTEPGPVDPADLVRYRRPSRYCQSDELAPTAHYEFQGLSGLAAIDAVESWVHSQLFYVPGSSDPTDGAVETLLAREGVCRDYAHLVIALLRALDVPARLAAVYAPGLSPMDFHAVVEAYAEGSWHVVDATRLAPRKSMVRIATGRDAADTAFMTSAEGKQTLNSIEVTAVAEQLPDENHAERVQLV